MTAHVPHPNLIDSLCTAYGHHNRDDIIACYQNAHLAWRYIPPDTIENEPMLITARAFRVRSVYARTPEERAWANYCESLILQPYRTR
jgi:hypothetical protein